MKTIFQDYAEDGCGAACIAMLAGITYEAARSELFGNRKVRPIPKRSIMAVLDNYNMMAGEDGRLGNIEVRSLKSNALLKGYVECDGEDCGHWMVWDHEQQVVRDPYGWRAPLRLTSYTLIVEKKR